MSERRCFFVLSFLLLIEFVILAIDPLSRSDWLLENALVIALALALGISFRWFRFSRLSYVLIFVFLSIHEIGAHYTYSNVPYDSVVQRLFGVSLNQLLGWQRNQFDRLVHLAYGLLLALPLMEFCRRVVGLGPGWARFFALMLVMATSMFYELIEWGAAVVFGGGLGQAFLGTQGDPWDSQEDMLLATLGALIILGLDLSIRRLGVARARRLARARN